MSTIEANLKYTEDHEWISVDGDIATIGITDFAQSSLGDIVFVELPETGSTLDAGSSFGVVESIKSVSDLYAPVAGEVTEINEELEGSPENINRSAYASWMIRIKMSDMSELDKLLTAQQYKEFCESN